ncbi:MAG: PqiC family protein [Syntrophobacterales bacterium]|nr:PqiC family protein [Syntrophobacterales bacterium]
MNRRILLTWWPLSVLAGLLLTAGACSRPPILVQRYVLEYPAPAFPRQTPLPEAVKVQPFAAAEAINTTHMLYRPDAYQRQAYVYHQWRITPGPLVTDSLVRDLRHAGLFQAVFTEDSPDRARFRLEGGVTEMQEENHPAGWQAVLGLSVTLLDTNYPIREVSRRVMFQKSYRAVEPMPDQTPRGLAEALSRAMGRLSREIIADLYRAAQTRLAEKAP